MVHEASAEESPSPSGGDGAMFGTLTGTVEEVTPFFSLRRFRCSRVEIRPDGGSAPRHLLVGRRRAFSHLVDAGARLTVFLARGEVIAFSPSPPRRRSCTPRAKPARPVVIPTSGSS